MIEFIKSIRVVQCARINYLPQSGSSLESFHIIQCNSVASSRVPLDTINTCFRYVNVMKVVTGQQEKCLFYFTNKIVLLLIENQRCEMTKRIG